MSSYRKLTDEEKAKIIELYNTRNCDRKQLANIYGCSKSAIDRVLADNRDIVKLRKQPNVKFTSDEDLRLIQLYREGTPIMRIADIMGRSLTSVYNRAVGLGIHVSKRNSNQGRYVDDCSSLRALSEAIYPEDLVDMRANVKVGDIMQIRTCKGLTEQMNNGGFGGAVRDARVVNTDHPRFCLLEIVGSGIMESRLWVDMVMEQRQREKVKAALANG